jgi:hypothetical protein
MLFWKIGMQFREAVHFPLNFLWFYFSKKIHMVLPNIPLLD